MGVPSDDLAQSKALLRSCLLLLLAEKPSHGYDLMERVKEFGFDWGRPGPLYADLRVLVEADLLSSTFAEPASGPARRIYRITDQGLEELARSALRAHILQSTLREYLARVSTTLENRPPGNGRKLASRRGPPSLCVACATRSSGRSKPKDTNRTPAVQ